MAQGRLCRSLGCAGHVVAGRDLISSWYAPRLACIAVVMPMPIFLEPPSHSHRGVDGRGHNRMAVLLPIGDECALRPTSEATFWDSHDTRKARYGNYGPCTNAGRCESCTRYSKTEPWQWFGDELVVRVDDDGYPWIMNRPDDGWGEWGKRVTWEFLLRVEAEFVRCRDQHGPMISMRRAEHDERRT